MEKIYWAKETEKAIRNFKISNLPFPFEFIKNLALIKKAAALANYDLKLLSEEKKAAIVQTCEEIAAGKFNSQFPVDIFQTGSGTSTNMNMNEVIAARANEILTGKLQHYYPVHPNDDVNLCQSSNDVIPSAINLTIYLDIQNIVIPALEKSVEIFSSKKEEFSSVLKVGRTHLMDAVAMTFGQEFSGYLHLIQVNLKNLHENSFKLLEMTLGGTAVGNGINAHPEFTERVIAHLCGILNLQLVKVENHFAAQSVLYGMQQLNSSMRNLAVVFFKIGTDIRLMASGPVAGLNEIFLPELQAGSSIMPGKINPVLIEVLLQAALTVISSDLVTTISNMNANFELNTFMPVIFYQTFFNNRIFARAVKTFVEKCVAGIKINYEKNLSNLENNPSLVTIFVKYIGYDRAAEIARKCYTEKKSVRQALKESGLLSEVQVDQIIDDYLNNLQKKS